MRPSFLRHSPTPTQRSSAREVAVIFRIVEMDLDRRWIVSGAKAKILIYVVSVDYFARVHFPLRVPYRLELAEGTHQFIAIHDRQQVGLGLTVAVLAGN